MAPPPPALDAPYYRAPYHQAIRRFFVKYATFHGRASRSEYWWSLLTSVVVTGGLSLVSGLGVGAFETPFDVGLGAFRVVDTIPDVIGVAFTLATFIPVLALTWRRLHDANLSGAWYFICLLPFVGLPILLFLVAFGPDPEGARFDDPTKSSVRSSE